MPEEEHDRVEVTAEYRSMTTDIAAVTAAVATPVAIVVQPVVAAWADQHFSHGEKLKDESPSQEPKK
jgi:hypothetical protein